MSQDKPTPAEVRAHRREQAKPKQDAAQRQAALQEARTSPHAVINTPKGRIPLGRTVKVSCPLYGPYTDEEGNEHEGLVVTFRTDTKQKHLDNQVMIHALAQVARIEGESEADYKARRDDALNNLSVESWCKRLKARCVGFEGWDFLDEETLEPIPAPNPLEWGTYRPLVLAGSALLDVGLWCLYEGWDEAIEKQIPN